MLVIGPALADDKLGDLAAIDRAIDEASAQFDLSPDLIGAVLAAESGGRRHAISSKGAMGLMQLMPETWRDLRAELGLGSDPFEPRDNILAGARYLRTLYDRFGSPGYLAAYNAGPGRYQRHLNGAPLPRETILYVARVQSRLGARDASSSNAIGDWRLSGLFAGSGSPTEPEARKTGLFVASSRRARP